MKKLLLLFLIPFVAGAQVLPPNPLGHAVEAGKKTDAIYGGNHTYFVDAVNGNDANAGNGQSTAAWRTIAKVNGHSFANGDSILLQRGCTWAEALVVPRSGLHFGNYGSGAKPMLNYATPRGFDFNGKDSITVDGIDQTGADRGFDFENTIGTHVVYVTNCTLRNNPLRGFDFGLYNDLQVTNALLDHDSVFNCVNDEAFWFGNGTEVAQYCYGSGNLINFRVGIRGVNCKYLHCRAENISLGYGGGEAVNIEHEDPPLPQYPTPIGTVISGCWLEGVNGAPTVENRGINSTFTDNVIIGHNTGYIGAIRQYQPFSGTVFYNNTIISDGGYCVLGFDNVGGTTFKNNIIVGISGTPLLKSDNGTHDGTWISDYNDWQGTGGFVCGSSYSKLTAFASAVGGDSHSIASDPLFTSNYANLHLQGGSPCVNAGSNVGLTTDFDGRSLAGIPDIGAYEYGVSVLPPSAPVAESASNITSSSFMANWITSSGATGFKLDVSTTSGFSSYVSGYQNLDLAPVTFHSVTGLASNTTYYYRIRAYNSGGTSGNSNTITVTTAAVSPPAALLPSGSFSASPDTLIARGSVTLVWTDSNATSASIDNGVGSVSISGGKMTLTVDSSVTFFITLTNSVGSRKYKAAITVLPPAKEAASSRGPVEFSLHQNYPNPFNPVTTIRYELPWGSHVTITVYDMLGRAVSVLVNDRREAGAYQVMFDGSNLASGMYFYILQAGSFVVAKKLLLLR
jgi:hypothetical protein